MIFETHAHYDDEQFDEDREKLLSQIHQGGVEVIVNAGASLESVKKGIELTKEYDFFYAAAGVHPSDVGELTEESFLWLKQQCEQKKVVGIGEIGLDYYWEKDQHAREKQKYWFKRQLELAREIKLPVIIHSRDAAEATLELMKNARAEEIPGVVHCYSYSKELSKEWLAMGYYLGIGGVVTFKNAKKLVETVEATPLERLLLETDAPYLSPEPYRGKRNQSLYLTYVAEKISEIKGIPVKEVMAVTKENGYRLFQNIPRV